MLQSVSEGHSANKEHIQVYASQAHTSSPHVWPMGSRCQLRSIAQEGSLGLDDLSLSSTLALWTPKCKIH